MSFITNAPNSKTLEARLRDLLVHSQELSFLVGFFYFSDVLDSSLFSSWTGSATGGLPAGRRSGASTSAPSSPPGR